MPRITLLLSCAFAGMLTGTLAASAQTLIIGNADGYACFAAARSGAAPAQGIQACDTALKSDALTAHNRAATLLNRGMLHDKGGDYAAAWKDFNDGVAIEPGLGDGYLNCGAELIRLKRDDEALADIQKAMALGVPSPEVAYYDLAVAEQDMGRVTDAYHDFQHALAQNPGYAPAQKALAHFTVIIKPDAPTADG